MHRLKPGGVAIPRAFKDHRTLDGYRYRVYVTALLARLGALPKDAAPTLREAGRAAVELERLGFDLDDARRLRRRRDASRIRRQQFMLREQLGRLERRLEELATKHGGPVASPAEYLRLMGTRA